MEEQVEKRTESSNKINHNRIENPWWNPPRYDHDQFSEFMFGAGRGRKQNAELEQARFQQQNQTYIDYEQLMVSIDTLVESARNLKPLVQRFFPFLEKFWKKK